MKKIYINVKGMTCFSCENKIIKNLKKNNDIHKVTASYEKKIVIIEMEDNTNQNDIIKIINNLGYRTNLNQIYENEIDFNNKHKIRQILTITICIFIIYFIIAHAFGFDFIKNIPEIKETVSLSALFFIGLATSVHCIGMCGSINLYASLGIEKKTTHYRPILYNLGRVVSYTTIGAIAGGVGSLISFNNTIQGLLIMIVSILMFIMGLSMLDILQVKIKLLPNFFKSKKANLSPFVIGLLNGLMPCGPLQAVTLYAISTSSISKGALSMFLFALGTVPLMVSVGLILTKLKGKYTYLIGRISSIFIVLLSLFMLTRALGYLGVDISLSKSNIDYQKAIIKDDYQIVEIDVTSNNYKPIIVQKDIPVRFNLKAKKGSLNGCNNSIIIDEYNIKKSLQIGDNIVEFTPTKTGTFLYTCWMSMIKSKIKVVDNLEDVE